MKYAVALLVSSTEAATFVHRYAVDGLMRNPYFLAEGAYPGKDFNAGAVEHCPDFDERQTLVNGRTQAVAYPAKGWNCHRSLGLAEVEGPYPGKDFNAGAVEHCPDFDERQTLVNGRTQAVAYPAKGWNCHRSLGLAETEAPYPGKDFNAGAVEHCPDFDERQTLVNGRTQAVAYPAKGWNCHRSLGLSEVEADAYAMGYPGKDFNP